MARFEAIGKNSSLHYFKTGREGIEWRLARKFISWVDTGLGKDTLNLASSCLKEAVHFVQ